MKTIVLFLSTLIISAGLLTGFGASAHAAGGLNNFTINTYQVDYYLARDANNRSTLKTVEKITALFPSSDQNHGVERAVPQSYDGHSTNLVVNSVTDGAGNNLSYSMYASNGNQVIRVGDAATYVHGTQQYEISYTQRDVTQNFINKNSDDFYWDTNGIEWAVPIQSLNVTLHIQEALLGALNGNTRCYVGVAGSNSLCELSKTSDGFATQATNLMPHENVTLAVGFRPQTFSPYKPSPFEQVAIIWSKLVYLSLIPAIIWIYILLRRYSRQSSRKSERTTIVPEYLPPKDTSVTVSASIDNKTSTAFSAQLIDFAVRHYIKIYQTREKSLFKKAQYELEIIKDVTDLLGEEKEILWDIFPANEVIGVGSRLKLEDLKKDSVSVSIRLSDNTKKLDANIRGTYGLRAKNAQQNSWFKRAAAVTLVVAILTLSPWLLVASILSFVLSFMLWPLTDKGLTLYHYLEGLKMYIKVAETDRLRMLQSPEGALKLDATLDVNDPRQLVKLYERVLPYAILFGLEKDWNNQLGQYYETLNQSPDWYQGNNVAFNAVVFANAMSSFSSAATYSNPSSSSSGGSGGGGFSGGGGGGGGGGGW